MTAYQLFVLHWNTWSHTTVTKNSDYYLDIITLNHVIVDKLFVLDRNTWKHSIVSELIVLNRNAWKHTTES